MKIEAIKSIVLTALILFSILFTLAIWNYQPSYEALNGLDFSNPKLNGAEETKEDIIEPQSIIFHIEDQHLRLEDESAEEAFYANIQNLSLIDFESISETRETEEGDRVELLFPLALSGRTLSDLFTIVEEDIPTEGRFDKISISLENGSELSRVEIIDTSNNEQFVAHIRRDSIEQLMNNYDDQDSFAEQVTFQGKDNHIIYLPAEEPELSEYYYLVNLFADSTEINPLVNVLFSDDEVVYPNTIPEGQQYTDGIKEIKVYNNYMEFVDPLAKYSEMDRWSLIDESLSFINNHKGWTNGAKDEYQLEEVNTSNNTVAYQLYYGRYPVIDEYNHLTTIELTIHGKSIYRYSRPLIQLQDELTATSTEIGSGERAISLIEENNELSPGMIEDISIGYKLTDEQTTVELIPSWFYKDETGWKEIPVPETVNGEEA